MLNGVSTASPRRSTPHVTSSQNRVSRDDITGNDYEE